jgi:UDP-N-acetylmuramate dehydrogenase
MSVVDRLREVADVREDERMSRHTTFGIGGPADYFVRARDEAALRAAATAAHAEGVPVFVLGAGSNILVGDSGVRGVVLEHRMRGAETPQFDINAPPSDGGEHEITVSAGTSFARLARASARQGLGGLEWAAGIPGTLGGAVVYNAGAYGGCLADVLIEIRVLEADSSQRTIAADALGLAYRSSEFTRGLLRDRLILTATLRLQRRDPAVAVARIDELESRRKASAPRGRNAGSVFKNPSEHPAWWLIDQVGLRGHRIGDAQISEKHTNYVVNVGEARAADVAELMTLAQGRVAEGFGIALEPEVSRVGEGFA